ncbi:hypothetical protein [Nocardia sp. NPDC049149]|uniref:hypothetical protein n=1 Tax=Nocardia sp. NPDC049149 TaxID=3364315 RepID=UPI003722F4B6
MSSTNPSSLAAQAARGGAGVIGPIGVRRTVATPTLVVPARQASSAPQREA